MRSGLTSGARHLRISEVAERLGFSKKWVYQQIQLGKLKCFVWSPTNFTVREDHLREFEAAHAAFLPGRVPTDREAVLG